MNRTLSSCSSRAAAPVAQSGDGQQIIFLSVAGQPAATRRRAVSSAFGGSVAFTPEGNHKNWLRVILYLIRVWPNEPVTRQRHGAVKSTPLAH